MIPKGKLLIIGGAEDRGDNDPDMKKKNKAFEQFEILKELLPKENGARRKIEIITTASDMPDEMNKMYVDSFKKIGFHDTGFIKIETKEEARNPEFVKRIEKCHAVLFTGGDQFKLSAILGGTDTIDVIKERYEQDKDFVIAGTSAGAAVMPKIMIYEGGVNEALLKDDLKISSGLGIFDTCIVDTHFVKRGRFGRLAHAITMNPEALGVGLGEDTALLVKNGFDAECRGSGMVIIIDGREIGQTNITEADPETPIFVENLRVHVLAKGCRFSIKDRQMTKPATRQRRPQKT
jgi:cyanophycinase